MPSSNLVQLAKEPEHTYFIGLNIAQNDEYRCSIDFYIKLDFLKCFPLALSQRRQTHSAIYAIEINAFMSINVSIGWLSIFVSPLCAVYISHLQQKQPKSTISALISQADALNHNTRSGTLNKFYGLLLSHLLQYP